MIIKPWDVNRDGTTDFYTVLLPPNNSSGGRGSQGGGEESGCLVVGLLAFFCLLFVGSAIKHAIFPEDSSTEEPAAVAVDHIAPAIATAAPEADQRAQHNSPPSPEPREKTTRDLIQAFFAIPLGHWRDRLSHIDCPVESEPWVRAFEEEIIRRNPNAAGFKYDSVSLDGGILSIDGIPAKRYGYHQKKHVTVRWFLPTPGHSGTVDVVVVRRADGLKISWWDTYLPYLKEWGWVDAEGRVVRPST